MHIPRSVLIAGGCVASFTGVMFITPPKFSPNIGPVPSVPTPTPSTCVTVTPTPSPTIRIKKHSEDGESSTALPAVLPTPQVSCSTPTPKNTSANGTFTGAVSNTQYGPVQVQITVSAGIIKDAQAIQSPSGGRSSSISSSSIPVLRQETLSAQSASIQAVSGASYTSAGWINSLVSALSQAGM